MKLLLCRLGVLSLLCLLVSQPGALFAADVALALPHKNASVSPAMYSLMSHMCEQQIQPMLVSMQKNVLTVDAGTETRRQLCTCTLDAAFSKPSMSSMLLKAVKSGSMIQDPELKTYFSARVGSAMFTCLGDYLDKLAEAAPVSQPPEN